MNEYRINATEKNDPSGTIVRGLALILLLGITGCGEVFDQLDESAKKKGNTVGATTAPSPPSPPLPPTPEQLNEIAVTAARDNLRKLSAAFRRYQEKEGSLPAAETYDQAGKPLLSWRVELLPHLGQQDLYDQFHHDEPWDSPHNLPLAQQIPDVYSSPNRKKSAKTNFLVPVGPLTLFGQKKGIALGDVNGPLTMVALVVEVNDSRAVVWTEPNDLRLDVEDPETNLGKAHDEGFFVLFADSRVDIVRPDIELETLESYLSLKEGQIVIPEPEKQYSPSLAGESERAFEAGKGAQAVRLLKGAALVGVPGVDLTKLMRWSPTLRRPTMAVRWAVGWQTLGIPKTSLPDSARATPGIRDQVRIFQSETFDYGEELLKNLSDRCDSGFFGAALEKQPGKDEERPRTDGVALSGITMLGEGDLKQLQESALETGCDLLLFTETKYRPGSKSTAGDEKKQSSSLTVKIIQATTGEELWASKPITSGHIERIKKNPDAGSDPLEDMYDQFTEFISQNLALSALPNLNADQVKRRVVSLISPPPNDPLDVLTEIKLYESMQLLTPEEVSKVYQRLLGDTKGAELATGTPAEREKAIEPLLP